MGLENKEELKKRLGYYDCKREMPAVFPIQGMPLAWTDILLCSLPKWAQMTAFLQLTTENKNREVQSSQVTRRSYAKSRSNNNAVYCI